MITRISNGVNPLDATRGRQKQLIVGNWKMNPRTVAEARKIVSSIKAAVGSLKKTDVVVCPPSVFLGDLVVNGSTRLAFGTQNVHFEKDGAFTGEISVAMIASLKAKYVILGHSERREMGETDDLIAKKVHAALEAGLSVILCVGEKERDPECAYLDIMKSQIEASLHGIPKNMLAKLIIAYEPVWAIGAKAKGVVLPEELLETIIFIRKILSGMYDQPSAHAMKILYGGSVDENNAGSFMKEGGAAGLLVGRASVEAKKFVGILKVAESL
ncbi:MAG: triose-phosphate isomerase [Candidatus Paceibacterota bacterium]|jgi:triosephosphate isomerase|nr:triose-phosphate isomerase [Candidatus Paceibacterota bacterium]